MALRKIESVTQIFVLKMFRSRQDRSWKTRDVEQIEKDMNKNKNKKA